MSKLLLQAIKTATAGAVRPDGSSALGWYKLNNSSDPAVNNGTGGGAGLYAKGGATWGQPLSTLSWAGSSLKLDNKSADYADGAGDVDLLGGAGAFTIALWTYLTAVPDTSGLYTTSHLLSRTNYITYNPTFDIYWGANGGGIYNDYDVVWIATQTTSGAAYSRFYIPFSTDILNKICYWVFTRTDGNFGTLNKCIFNGVEQTRLSVGTSYGNLISQTATTNIGGLAGGGNDKSIPGIYSNLIINNTYTDAATALATYNAGLP